MDASKDLGESGDEDVRLEDRSTRRGGILGALLDRILHWSGQRHHDGGGAVGLQLSLKCRHPDPEGCRCLLPVSLFGLEDGEDIVLFNQFERSDPAIPWRDQWSLTNLGGEIL